MILAMFQDRAKLGFSISSQARIPLVKAFLCVFTAWAERCEVIIAGSFLLIRIQRLSSNFGNFHKFNSYQTRMTLMILMTILMDLKDSNEFR